MSKGISIHAIASFFKLWLRNQKEPIFPESLEQDISNSKTKSDALQVVQKLKPSSKSLLIDLISFLRRLDSFRDKTYMDIDNLCIIFSANLFVSSDTSDPLRALSLANGQKRFLTLLFEK